MYESKRNSAKGYLRIPSCLLSIDSSSMDNTKAQLKEEGSCSFFFAVAAESEPDEYTPYEALLSGCAAVSSCSFFQG